LVAVIVLAAIEGSLVALPRADALQPLGRLRSPAWAALLPGSILLGTFGPLALPPFAVALVVMAAVATPLLAVVAVVGVVRGPRAALNALALALPVAALVLSGSLGQASYALITALGCLALGTALVRLTPRRWILVGVVCMCALDVLLLMSGAGESAATAMSLATAQVHAPAFDQASLGPIATDYPDLVLAALLGALLAGHQYQGRAAVLVTALAGGSGMFLPLVGWLPATVPVTVGFILYFLERIAVPRRAPARSRTAGAVATGTPAPHEAAA
jgi:hypothetical protein